MSVDAALQLISTIRSLPPPTTGYPDARARTYGAQLADTHDVDVLHEILARHGDDPDLVDLFACWMQELVLREAKVGGPDVDRLIETLVARAHPLANLPLYLLSSGEAHNQTIHALPRIAPDYNTPDVTPLPAPDDLGAIWQPQCEISNGRMETCAYELAPSILRAPDPALVKSLPHAWLAGDLGTAEIAFADVVSLMLRSAGMGAYGSSPSRAYGRHYTWRTLAAFARLPYNGSLHEIARYCEQMFWASIDVRNGWFYNDGWDLGIAAISADGSTLTIFAGTDTD